MVIDPFVWKAIDNIEKNHNKKFVNFTNHWDSASLYTYELNNKRTNDGLFNLHWL